MRSYSVNKLHEEAQQDGSVWGDAAFILILFVGTFSTLAAFVS